MCVCVYICACVLSLAYDECLKHLWLLWGTSCDIICFLHGFSYNYKRLCKSASICECQSLVCRDFLTEAWLSVDSEGSLCLSLTHTHTHTWTSFGCLPILPSSFHPPLLASRVTHCLQAFHSGVLSPCPDTTFPFNHSDCLWWPPGLSTCTSLHEPSPVLTVFVHIWLQLFATYLYRWVCFFFYPQWPLAA